MSWFNLSWDGLKNKTCRYLMQRYLGQFLEEKINLQQLNIELYNGRATVKNVCLKVQALNDIFEDQGWSIEVVSGVIGTLTVTVPWNALMTNNSSIEVFDAVITLRPIKRINDGTSMLESMWSSVSSTMQLAEECMNQDYNDPDDIIEVHTNSIVGLEKFAETIDSVLNRIKGSFRNTTIRLEHPAANGIRGIAIVINITELIYKNETGSEHLSKDVKTQTDSSSKREFGAIDEFVSERINFLPTYAKHNIIINGLQLHSEEFRLSEMSTQHDICSLCDRYICEVCSIPMLKIQSNFKIEIKLKQSEEIQGPKVCLDFELGNVFGLLSPRQIHLISKMIDAFQSEELVGSYTAKLNKRCDNLEQQKFETQHCDKDVGILKNPSFWGDRPDIIELGNVRLYQHENITCDSLSTSMSSSNISGISRFQRKFSNIEKSGEILNLYLKATSISILILEQDMLEKDVHRNCCPISDDYLKTACNIFENLRDCEECIQSIRLCAQDHIYLELHSLSTDITQQRNRNILSMKLSATITSANVFEVLNGKINPVLYFYRNEIDTEGFQKKPDIVLLFKSTSHYNSTDHSVSSLDITLEKCSIELDISIYDRLSAMLSTSPFMNNTTPMSNKSAPSCELNLMAYDLDLNLRIPVADFRANDDPERIPWWKQHIRAEYLLLNFLQFKLKYTENYVNIMAEKIDVFFCPNTTEKIFVMQLHSQKNAIRMTDSDVCNIRITLCVPTKDLTLHIKASTDHKNLPFSSKKVCRQSDTIYTTETETILLPGDLDEISMFRNLAKKSSKLQITIRIPNASIVMESKQLYELIYNRLNNDLFMWEPHSPIFTNKTETNSDMTNSLYFSSTSNNLLLSNNHLDKSYVNNKDSKQFYEFFDKAKKINVDSNVMYIQPNDFALDISIGSANLSAFLPVRDSKNNVVPEIMGKLSVHFEELQIFSVNGYNGNNDVSHLCIDVKDVEVYHCDILPEANNHLINDQSKEFMKSTFYKVPPGLKKNTALSIQKRELISVVIEIKKVSDKKVKRIKVTSAIQQMALRHSLGITSNHWLNQLIDFLDVTDYSIDGYTPFGAVTELQLHFWDCAVDYRPKSFPFRAVIEIGSFSINSNIISSVAGCNLRFVIEECYISLAPYDCDSEIYKDNVISCIASSNLVTVVDIGLLDISVWIKDSENKKSPYIDFRCAIQDGHLRTCFDSATALAQFIAYIATDCEQDASKEPSFNTTSGLFSVESNTFDVSNKQQERVNLLMAEAVQDSTTQNFEPFQTDKEQVQQGFEVFFFPGENNKINESLEASQEYAMQNEICDILNFETNVMLQTYYKEPNSEDTLPQIKEELGDVTNCHGTEKSFLHEEDFYVIADDEKSFLHTCGFQDITLSDDPLRIVDNHFRLPTGNRDLLLAPENFPTPTTRYTLCEMTFTWHLYGGLDFPDGTANILEKIKPVSSIMSEAYKRGVSQSHQVNSSHNEKKPKEKITWKTEGGSKRNHEVLVEMQFTKIRFSHEVYPVNTSYASRQVLLVYDIEIRDRLQSSDIKKFLYNPNIKSKTSKSSGNMVVVKTLHVRPNPKISNAQECSLRISLVPMRLHIDQDTLVFLIDYFSSMGDKCIVNNSKSQSTPMKNETYPMMIVDDVPEAVKDLQARKLIQENLDILIDDDTNVINNPHASHNQKIDEDSPIYFREVIFSPDVSIRFDYHGRRVELSKGPIAGLLMGLGQLQCSQILLKKQIYRRGLLGVDKLLNHLLREWLNDIRRNQLPKILSGVGPTYAFVQLFQGVYDLFWLPVEQFQKDGRIIRGLQLGAQSFTARTALAALELTSRIVQLLQFTAETTFDIVSPGPSMRRNCNATRGRRKRTPRPVDIREGMTNAYWIVKDGIHDSAQTLIATAVSEHDQKGYTGAVGAVMRQIPQLVVCPAVLATQATNNIIGGVRNSLVPEAQKEAREKWKDETD